MKCLGYQRTQCEIEFYLHNRKYHPVRVFVRLGVIAKISPVSICGQPNLMYLSHILITRANLLKSNTTPGPGGHDATENLGARLINEAALAAHLRAKNKLPIQRPAQNEITAI